jgi:hypothetical protein
MRVGMGSTLVRSSLSGGSPAARYASWSSLPSVLSLASRADLSAHARAGAGAGRGCWAMATDWAGPIVILDFINCIFIIYFTVLNVIL